MLAEEHEGIDADVTLIGKALSGGFYPVSAVLTNTDMLGVLKPGEQAAPLAVIRLSAPSPGQLSKSSSTKICAAMPAPWGTIF